MDCVRIGLGHVAPDAEWILSGINEGETWARICTARERWPQCAKRHCWASRASRSRNTAGAAARLTGAAPCWTADVVRLLLAERAETGMYWNVNLPDLDADAPDPKIVFCPLDPHPLNLDYRMVEGRYRYATNYHQRPREPGHDIDCCFSGRIAVTQLRMPAVPAVSAVQAESTVRLGRDRPSRARDKGQPVPASGGGPGPRRRNRARRARFARSAVLRSPRSPGSRRPGSRQL